MAESDIIRPLTEDEKKSGVIELGRKKKKTIHDIFREKLIIKEQFYTRNHRPFCARCAKIEFTDLIDTKMKDSQRRIGSSNVEDLKIDIDFGDLERYADSQRFRLHETNPEKEISETKLVDGVRTTYHRGYFVNFICKVRDCGISVEMDISVYDDWKKEWNSGGDDKLYVNPSSIPHTRSRPISLNTNKNK